MSDSEEEVVLMYMLHKRAKVNRNVWVREILLNREQQGEFFILCSQLWSDEDKFQNYYRMSQQCFKLLVQLVEPNFHIGHTNYRKSISFLERLTVTIRYLANGESFASASYRWRISANELSIIINGMLNIIYISLKDVYLKYPTREDWIATAQGFLKNKSFPNCVGAVDGKHIRIKKPTNCGSLYYNYKHFHSIVLLSIVDSSYTFLIVDVGSMGKNSDGGIFDNSEFGKLFKKQKLDLPENSPIEDNGTALPHVFIGDEAFRLTENFMKPYPRKLLDNKKRIFNYRLSYARSTVECAFGILVSKFRIFETAISVHPDKVDAIILAGVVLHNMIRTVDCTAFEDNNNLPNNFGTFVNFSSNTPTQDSPRANVNQSTARARNVRDRFSDYFVTNGKVAWQDQHVLNDEENI